MNSFSVSFSPNDAVGARMYDLAVVRQPRCHCATIATTFSYCQCVLFFNGPIDGLCVSTMLVHGSTVRRWEYLCRNRNIVGGSVFMSKACLNFFLSFVAYFVRKFVLLFINLQCSSLSFLIGYKTCLFR